MTEKDKDRAEVSAAQRAVETAEVGVVRTEAAVASVHRASADIRAIVERNGYVDRFRTLLRGA